MPMIVNTRWLQEYLEPSCPHEAILEALPRIGLEIEAQHELRTALADVRVGFVREMKPVVDAARGEDTGLFLCAIEMSRGTTIPVVCASEHEVRVGWGVPVARAGTTLPNGREIRAGRFHGVESQGMICLDGELGMIARDSGMHHFDDEAALGAPLPKLVDVDDHLVELNVLPNRPDFLGLIGIAREIAAFLRIKLRMPETFLPRGAGRAPSFSVEIRDAKLCPRYAGALVRGVRVAPSPGWLKAKLLVAGLRPRSNVVDITNYVLYEYGQPLHAFDFDRVGGGRVVVRRIAQGESLKLLDRKTTIEGGVSASSSTSRRADDPPLVIADAARPMALAGIMGGADSETTDATTNVLVEAAHFDPVDIRRTVRRLALRSDASQRFERGTDPDSMLEGALGRALALLRDVAGAHIDEPIVDQYPTPMQRRTVTIDAGRTSSYLGMPVEAATIRDCLGRLAMECDDNGTVRVPTWRWDVNDPVVLMEDVARLVGYDRIPVEPRPAPPSMGRACAADRLRNAVAAQLVGVGFLETRSPSLESPEASDWLGAAPPTVTIANAATRDMSVLRRSLLPGLLRTVDNNIRRAAPAVRFFEIDRAFRDPAGAKGDLDGGMGRWSVAAIAGGLADRSNWRAGTQELDFHMLKGVLEDLLEAIGCRAATFRAAEAPPYVSGAAAEIVVKDDASPAGARSIGWLGEIDPALARIDRLGFGLFAFELDLVSLEAHHAGIAAYRALSRLPAVTRDLAVIVPVAATYADLESEIRATAGPELESLRLVDLYQGSPVPAGHRSLAFHLVFRSQARTLTAEDVAGTMTTIAERLRARFKAELRA